MKTTWTKITDSLYMTWIVAAKDILEALKSKLVLSLILSQLFMVSLPVMLRTLLAGQYSDVLIYDPGKSQFASLLASDPDYQVQTVSSIEEMGRALHNASSVQMGFAIPADFDQVLATGGPIDLAGYTTWANRGKALEWKGVFEDNLSEMLGVPVRVTLAGNLYPPGEIGLTLGIATLSGVLVTLLMGINLIPSLIVDEKQTRTLDSLLVSPASIGQIVIGKALVGIFYVLVAGGILLVLQRQGVVHWGPAVLFVLGCGVFTAAVGLVLGMLFDRMQDMQGSLMAILVVLLGGLFVEMLGVDLPAMLQPLVPWVPSVTLLNVYRTAFAAQVPWNQIWLNLGGVLGISMLLYILAAWLLRRSDR